jgi:hypothetical protein
MFSKNTQISNFMKICPVGAELFHVELQTDKETDMMKPVVAFHNFANMCKNLVAKPHAVETSLVVCCVQSRWTISPELRSIFNPDKTGMCG